jgi:hypothetical protein
MAIQFLDSRPFLKVNVAMGGNGDTGAGDSV